MKLRGFDEFLKVVNFNALAEDSEKLMNAETSKIKDINDIEEVMKHFSKGQSAACADFTGKFLLAYHTWLQAQLETLLP